MKRIVSLIVLAAPALAPAPRTHRLVNQLCNEVTERKWQNASNKQKLQLAHNALKKSISLNSSEQMLLAMQRFIRITNLEGFARCFFAVPEKMKFNTPQIKQLESYIGLFYQLIRGIVDCPNLLYMIYKNRYTAPADIRITHQLANAIKAELDVISEESYQWPVKIRPFIQVFLHQRQALEVIKQSVNTVYRNSLGRSNL